MSGFPHRVQRRCSKCGGRMVRRGVWGRDLDGWAGGFDKRTGEPRAKWYWGCHNWVVGSALLVNVDHDFSPCRGPRHRPSGFYQARLNWDGGR